MDKSQEAEYSHLLPNDSLENERLPAKASYTATSPSSTDPMQNKTRTIPLFLPRKTQKKIVNDTTAVSSETLPSFKIYANFQMFFHAKQQDVYL